MDMNAARHAAGSGLSAPRAAAPGLADIAARVRAWSLTAIHRAGSGHPGGALSAVDLLTVLFHDQMRFDADRLDAPDRDRFVLSKGHSCPALYAVAASVGLIAPAELNRFRSLGSPLQGHPHAADLPWLDASAGSLAQGFSAAIGVAMGLRHQDLGGHVYVMLGDGEAQEGEVWEGAMCAAHHRLGNLCAVIDHNRLQSDDRCEAVMALEPLADKWRAFNWRVEVIDGHDIAAIQAAFAGARGAPERPTMVVANTVKGKGVPFMEDRAEWHGSVKMNDDEFAAALAALGVAPKAIREAVRVGVV